jgi:hypothetical protein
MARPLAGERFVTTLRAVGYRREPCLWHCPLAQTRGDSDLCTYIVPKNKTFLGQDMGFYLIYFVTLFMLESKISFFIILHCLHGVTKNDKSMHFKGCRFGAVNCTL